MIASKQKQFIFSGVEKCATTSMYHALSRFNTLNVKKISHPFPYDPYKEKPVFWVRNKKTALGKHVPFAAIEYIVPTFDDYFKFCIFRNPWEIFVSRYFYFRRKKMNPNRPQRFKIAHECSFIDFLTMVTPNLSWVYHLNNFYDFVKLSDETIGADCIYSFEHLDNMVKDLKQRFGIELNLRRYNATKHKPYMKYYEGNDEIIEWIGSLFSWGINLFGFEFDGKCKQKMITF